MKLQFINQLKGFGMIAVKPIRKGTFLGFVTGKVISKEETDEADQEGRDDYLFQFCGNNERK